MHILVGSPAYAGMMHMNYVNSLLDFQVHGIDFTLSAVGNESLITRARNTIISHFYENQSRFTHLLFLDADIELHAEGLSRMLSYEVDVIGAPVPLKAYRDHWEPIYNFSGIEEQISENLYSTDRIGTAALLLSKRAVVDLIEDAKDNGFVYKFSEAEHKRKELGAKLFYDVFRVGVVDEEYLSEDFWVCETLKKLGYKIHITDAVATKHFGMHGFEPKMEKNT